MARLPNTWFMADTEKLPRALNDTLSADKDVWVLFQKKNKTAAMPPSHK